MDRSILEDFDGPMQVTSTYGGGGFPSHVTDYRQSIDHIFYLQNLQEKVRA